jgi:translation initiation factor IF-2
MKEEKEKSKSSAASLEDLFALANQGEVQTINVIIKADSTGSAEAVKGSLEKLNNDKVKINVIRATSGAITESDVLLASASHALDVINAMAESMVSDGEYKGISELSREFIDLYGGNDAMKENF